MIANLPLLFANGNPTALSTISVAQLEKFITFMVTCSWGHDTAKDIRQPPWWPLNVEFTHPFTKPAQVPIDWEVRLKNLVRRCYDYHKSAFLLVFSAQLARYPRKRLRYVDNRDHTTSLYYRPSGRLLVTFRNENLFYDKEGSAEKEESLVKAADIYLCDNCDSHFDNLDTLQAHERLCNNDNVPNSTCNSGFLEFLAALKLQSTEGSSQESSTKTTDVDIKPKNSRTAANVDRGPPYPFSSLAYMKNAKTNVIRDSTYSRERIERYCCTSTSFNRPVDQPMEVDMKSSDPLKRLDNDCEVIDLCSDDEGQSGNENCDPRAGIACVMRGGAILRRTAATPHALPSEPCGARQRPLPTMQHLPSAILQPHPVILIAHTLNNLQTISLD
ncbi:unnamed protein product, partial [Iphiclides podalirius]